MQLILKYKCKHYLSGLVYVFSTVPRHFLDIVMYRKKGVYNDAYGKNTHARTVVLESHIYIYIGQERERDEYFCQKRLL